MSTDQETQDYMASKEPSAGASGVAFLVCAIMLLLAWIFG